MYKILTSVVVLGLFVSTPMLAVHAEAAESGAQEAAYGAGSVFTTLLYAPVKTGFCLVGAATSGLTLPFGGTETAGKDATAAFGGNWTITPGTLRAKETARFMGC